MYNGRGKAIDTLAKINVASAKANILAIWDAGGRFRGS